jgi:hypothetical protein
MSQKNCVGNKIYDLNNRRSWPKHRSKAIKPPDGRVHKLYVI